MRYVGEDSEDIHVNHVDVRNAKYERRMLRGPQALQVTLRDR